MTGRAAPPRCAGTPRRLASRRGLVWGGAGRLKADARELTTAQTGPCVHHGPGTT